MSEEAPELFPEQDSIPPQEDHDEIQERWARWLDRIQRDIDDLIVNRFMYQTTRDIMQGNAALPNNGFLLFLTGLYGRGQAIILRRQLEDRRRWKVVSLAALLVDMASHPEVVSRERYVAQWGNESWWQHSGHQAFDQLVGTDRNLLDIQAVCEDLDRLRERAESIKRWVDQQIAHVNEQPQEVTFTFNDMHELINELYRRYTWLLSIVKHTSRERAMPYFQYDWYATFRQTWLTPEVEKALNLPDPSRDDPRLDVP